MTWIDGIEFRFAPRKGISLIQGDLPMKLKSIGSGFLAAILLNLPTIAGASDLPGILRCSVYQEQGDFTAGPRVGDFIRVNVRQKRIRELRFFNAQGAQVVSWPVYLQRTDLQQWSVKYKSAEGPFELYVGSADGIWNFGSLTETKSSSSKATLYFECGPQVAQILK